MASRPTLQQLQDDIDLYKALIASSEDSLVQDPEMEDNKKYWQSKVDELTKQCRKFEEKSNQPNKTTSTIGSTAGLMNLPNRKRERGEFDDDLEQPRVKSRRSTPADSPALSAVDSIGSDYFDYPELTNVLGTDWKSQATQQAKERERRRRQEEEDERLARQLQEEWSNEAPASQPQKPPQQHTQATFRPNGSFSVPGAPHSVKTEPSATQPSNEPDVPSTAISSSSSSSDSLAVITPEEWLRRFPTTKPSWLLPPSFGPAGAIPGTLPGYQSAYTSMPGASVYGTLPGFPRPNLGLPASSSNPFSIDGLFDFATSQSWSALPTPWEVPDTKETLEEIKQLLNNLRPDEEIDPADAAQDELKGMMKIKLMPHQKKGLAWMKKMEEGSSKGGILADDMGLGKTIQAIALMLSKPPPPDKKLPTLVVCPVALMEQWKREIKKLVPARNELTVIVLHGQNAHLPWSRVKHYDVILTSYGTLASELKKKVKWQDVLKRNPGAQKTKKFETPVLDDKARFHRIFLDEAQNIKNKATQAAAAACRVDASYRWCLTGTPMQNNVDEMYSLIRFCRIRPYNDVNKWGKDIGRPLKSRNMDEQERAMVKLQALLKAILLRRTKKSKIDGKPILQLPEKHTTETRAIFNEDQLKFYQALETNSRIQFNRFIKNGRIGTNYSKALVLLLRLRQCCCSPQLVTNAADFVIDSGVEGIDMLANARALPPDVQIRLKDAALECPICFDAVDNPIIFNPCGHGLCHDCFSKMIDSVHQENANDIKCPHCRARIDTKKITDLDSFNEIFGDGKRSTLADREEASGTSDDEAGDDSDDDSDDVESNGSDSGNDLRDFIVDDDAPLESASDSDGDDLDRVKAKRLQPGTRAKSVAFDDGELSESDAFGRHKSNSRNVPNPKCRKKGKKSTKSKERTPHKSLADLRKEGLKSRAAKKKYLKQLSKIYEPCAKIDKTLELLQQIQEDSPNDKAIVFSSFTSFLDLIEVPLSREPNFNNYTRYDGSMTAKDRNEAVLRFTDDPSCRLILVSLKAGNAGLNLTVANHVILLDPFWNPFVEYQAADRCHRIGQKKEVHVHRVIIGEEGVDHEANPDHVFTVEDRILQLQEKKRSLVEAALDENAASNVSRLGTRELGYLFGVNDMPTRNGE